MIGASTTPKQLLPWGEGKKTAHQSNSSRSMGWGQAVGLNADPPTNENFSEDNIGKASSSLVLLLLWQMPELTQLKPKVAPDSFTNTKGTKHCPQLGKRATAPDCHYPQEQKT